MNICPGCEAEIEEGMELCSECAGGEKAGVCGDVKELDENEAMLTLEDGLSLYLSQDENVLGRRDPLEGIDPDVDLSIHGGFEGGVSRRHALICHKGKNWSHN